MGPQQYTLIKLKVIAPFPPHMKALEGMSVFLVAATLRPETMYGQTNCFVLPDGEYGAFKMVKDEVMTNRCLWSHSICLTIHSPILSLELS